MDSLSQHIVHAGWLIKSPPEKRNWKTKWRRRWFVLKLSGQIPGQYVLEYYTDSTCKKLKGQIDLDQCEQIDAGLQLEIRKQNYDNMFDLRTSKRTYYLVAGSEEEMNKWVECICAVCGLKMESIQNELTLLPSFANADFNNSPQNEERYSPQPSQTSEQSQHQQQPQHTNLPLQFNQQSTSESSLSTLNYIPISECYTGKPTTTAMVQKPMSHSHHHQSSPPPPRPPKPPTLLQWATTKSQSSLALWPQDQQQQQQDNPSTVNNKIHPPESIPLPSHGPCPSTNLPPKCLPMLNQDHNMSLYLNSSKPNNQLYNFYDTWHSRSKRPDFLSPPQVNRDLKPNRRRILEQTNNSQNQSGQHNFQNKNESQIVNNNQLIWQHQPFKRVNSSQPTMTNRHTLPRPLITNYTLRNNQNKFQNQNNNDSNYCHLAHCEQPKNLEDCERQYLDLDLDSESTTNNNNGNNSNSNSNSPRTNDNNNNNVPSSNILSSNDFANNSNCIISQNTGGQQPDLLNNHQLTNNNNLDNISLNMAIGSNNNSGTVYKKVDFLKTKAFNKLRVNMYGSNVN